MKKYVVPFLFAFLCITCVFCFGFGSQNFASASKYKTYVTSLNELVHDSSNYIVVDLGFCFEVVSDKIVKTKNTSSTLGESRVYFCDETEVNKILDNIDFVAGEKYKIDDVVVFEGKINGRKKAQVAFSKGQLTVGMPVIFGSY